MAAKGKLPVGSLDAILGAEDVKTETVEVPEWGCSVTVRGLTRGEARALGEKTPEGAEAYALHCAAVDPPIGEEEARTILDGKSVGATQRVLQAIIDLSGLGESFRS